MDLGFSEEYERFRAEVKEFLSEHWPPQGDEAKLGVTEQAALFRDRAIARGFLARGIPRAYGGSEQPPDVLRGTIISEEFGRAGAPQDPGPPTEQLIPTLLEHGSESQKERYLPTTVSGELVWCQGYSEPGAGSDLASLQTRAELVGDEWVINGQKIWTSGAHNAEMMYVLCRTEPDASKHAGISYLLMNMKQPGVEVSSLKQMTGDTHFGQVFFDDARTPADHIVGKRGEGWIVSRSTLLHERNAVGSSAVVRLQFEGLIDLAKSTKLAGRPAIQDPVIRQRLTEIEGYVTSHEYTGYRQLTCAVRGTSPGSVVTMNKLVSTEIGHMMAKLAFDLIGEDGLWAPAVYTSSSATARTHRDWITRYMMSLGLSIAGGTADIQRNIIGERALGLPRDFAVQRSR